jgi:hypothetical protein
VVGTGSESVLSYAVGATVKVLSDRGNRLYTWQAPGTVTNMTSYGREVAVFVRGGKCYVLGPSGAVRQSYAFRPGSVQEFALALRGLVVQLPGGRIEVHNGTNVRAFSIPRQARMLDYAGNILLYRLGGMLRGRFLFGGEDGALRAAPLGAVETNGFSYASGTNVGSIAWVTLTGLINRGR